MQDLNLYFACHSNSVKIGPISEILKQHITHAPDQDIRIQNSGLII